MARSRGFPVLLAGLVAQGFCNDAAEASGPRAPSAIAAQDRITLPPQHSEYESPGRRYRFVLDRAEGWRPRRSTGSWWRLADGGAERLWQRPLTHNCRPRFVIVDDEGHVLLLDEWLNVRSPQALTLIGTDNAVVAAYGFEDIRRVLDVPLAEIMAQARYGWWISAPPLLAKGARVARVATAGRELRIDMASGQLDKGPPTTLPKD